MNLPDNILKTLLKDTYFITGTAYAGKSTAVKRLAGRYRGICCAENYHMELLHLADPVHQPALYYFQTMSSWQDFIHRRPEDYAQWIVDCGREAAALEILLLIRYTAENKPIFVDTNIPLDILHRISDERHVAVMLSPQSLSVDRFFDRDDPEKRFILSKIEEAPDPIWAMENYREGLRRINSEETYRTYAESGFYTLVRTEESTPLTTELELARHFGLSPDGDSCVTTLL